TDDMQIRTGTARARGGAACRAAATQDGAGSADDVEHDADGADDGANDARHGVHTRPSHCSQGFSQPHATTNYAPNGAPGRCEDRLRAGGRRRQNPHGRAGPGVERCQSRHVGGKGALPGGARRHGQGALGDARCGGAGSSSAHGRAANSGGPLGKQDDGSPDGTLVKKQLEGGGASITLAATLLRASVERVRSNTPSLSLTLRTSEM